LTIHPVILLLFAPFIGSFLGVLVRRLPLGLSVARGRSRCEACDAPLTARDLVPIFSFLWLKGRCRLCGARIDPFHIKIELAAFLVALWAVAVDGADAGPDCVLGWALLALAWIDAEHMILPDVLTLPLLAFGLLLALVEAPDLVGDRLIGAAVGWLSFTAVSSCYRWLRQRDGLGGGDARLLSAAGAWLGWEALPSVVLLAAISALAGIGLVTVLRRGRQSGGYVLTDPQPFGPWLALAIWVVRLYGPPLG
jgi:leader peptidase (prepilin peptidase)/N-methyltransferase